MARQQSRVWSSGKGGYADYMEEGWDLLAEADTGNVHRIEEGCPIIKVHNKGSYGHQY